MEKLAEPLLFDDSGRHVDMTEIIENLYIGTQWVDLTELYMEDISTKFFCQGSCKEHVLPEEGDHLVDQLDGE